MFAYSAGQRDNKLVEDIQRYPFEIPMNDSRLVKVGHTGHDLGELKVIEDRKNRIRGGTASGLTNNRRFARGLDLVYSTRFPFFIHSETIRKL